MTGQITYTASSLYMRGSRVFNKRMCRCAA